MIKQDELGQFDDEEIPAGMSFPLDISAENEAMIHSDNTILALYGGPIEASARLQHRRKMAFAVKLANGELIILKDKTGNDQVFRRVKRTIGKNGNILCEFAEVRKAVTA